jgi:antitoxin ParD1/3/4
MSRQSISFTRPNDEWLRAQVNSEEFTSKSDVVNDLIRRAREIETIRARLIAAEQGGVTDLTPEQIRQRVRERLSDGEDV